MGEMLEAMKSYHDDGIIWEELLTKAKAFPWKRFLWGRGDVRTAEKRGYITVGEALELTKVAKSVAKQRSGM